MQMDMNRSFRQNKFRNEDLQVYFVGEHESEECQPTKNTTGEDFGTNQFNSEQVSIIVSKYSDRHK